MKKQIVITQEEAGYWLRRIAQLGFENELVVLDTPKSFRLDGIKDAQRNIQINGKLAGTKVA